MFVRLLRLPPEKMKESGERRASERAMKMLLLMLVAAAAHSTDALFGGRTN